MISVMIFGTPVKVSFKFLLIVAILWGGVTWLELYWHPEREFWQCLFIGFLTVLLLLFAEYGHPLGHIFSARYAGAPMDEIRISLDMARTLYTNNDVLPKVHRMRALGGSIFNLIGLLLSLAIYAVASGNPIAIELSGWSALGHGLLLIMSLSPIPSVDGGTILKWTLVERGETEREADEMVRRIDWVMGIGAVIIGVAAIAMKIWIAGLILVGIGIVVIGVTVRKIK